MGANRVADGSDGRRGGPARSFERGTTARACPGRNRPGAVLATMGRGRGTREASCVRVFMISIVAKCSMARQSQQPLNGFQIGVNRLRGIQTWPTRGAVALIRCRFETIALQFVSSQFDRHCKESISDAISRSGRNQRVR